MTVAHWYKTDVSVIYKVKGRVPPPPGGRPGPTQLDPTAGARHPPIHTPHQHPCVPPTLWTVSALSVTQKFAPLYFEGSFFRCCHNAVRA